MKPILSIFFFACFAFPVLADISVEFQLGAVDFPSGSLGALVADTSGNGFFSPGNATGTQLSAGQTMGGSDDKIVAVFSIGELADWGGSRGFAVLLDSIDYEALGITEGQPLVFYAFALRGEGDSIRTGEPFSSYRSDNPAELMGNMDFTLPADGGAYQLAALSGAQGGSSNLTAFVPPSAAIVSTYPATDLSTNSVTIQGNVVSDGNATVSERGFLFGTSPPLTTGNSTEIVSGAGLGIFDESITGLVPNTTYYTRAFAENFIGRFYGVTKTFKTVSLPLSEALDGGQLNWGTGGDAPWHGQVAFSNDGTSAATSGRISHNQNSWIEASVSGPGTLRFWWKVSSEQDRDIARFLLSDVEQLQISGEVDWQQREVVIPAGIQTLRWDYSKDGGIDSGANRVWLDQVEYVAASPPTAKFKGKKVIRTSRRRYTIRGKAFDIDGDLVSVRFIDNRIRSRKWRKTRGTYSWKATAILKPRRNTVKVQAYDAVGNRSRINRIKIIQR